MNTFFVPETHFPCGRDLAKHSLEQGAFTGTVLADDCSQFTAMDMEIDILDDFIVRKTYIEMIDFRTA